jgi:hypothetical protein
MNANQIIKLKMTVKEEEKEYDFNDYVGNYFEHSELQNINDLEELKEYLENINENRELTDKEEYYYKDAMDYLMEHDNTLTESLEIADELGFAPKDINSCTLASLLQTRKCEGDYDEFIEKVISQMEEYF